MLFGYPLNATLNNWVHDCICEAVRAIHAAADANAPYPTWPAILPEAHRETLKSRRGLRARLKAYNDAVCTLDKTDRDAVLEALDLGNRIAELLSGASECPATDALPEVVQIPVAELFGFAFDLLTDLEVRDQHYATIYAAAPAHVCPFCGTEYFDAPGAVREPLDHYLKRSQYAFAAVNLRNLVPMGHKCNSGYKGASDLLRRDDGSRRVAFDPYNHAAVRVSLDASEPFDGVDANIPNWTIQFDPDTPEVATWDDVFSVRDRYRRDHLDCSFSSWLKQFAEFARRAGVQAWTDVELVAALKRFEESFHNSGLQDRAFLKAAVFRMLRLHCVAGNGRLLDELRDLVSPLEYIESY